MTPRYSLRVGIIRSSVLIACTALAASCAQSTPPPGSLASARVLVSRIVSANVPPRPSGCAIEALTAMPAQPYRELGAIQVSEGAPNPRYIRAIIDHFACKMGADAIVMNPAQAVPEDGALKVTAIAYESNLATRAAQSPNTATASDDLNQESHDEFTQFPEAEIIPATSDESPANADSAQPETASAPMTEQQIGPAGGSLPALEVSPYATVAASPAARPSSTPTPASIGSATAATSPSPTASATSTPILSQTTPSPTPAPSPTVAATPMGTPSPTPTPTPMATATPATSPIASPARPESSPGAAEEETPAREASPPPVAASPSVTTTPSPSPSSKGKAGGDALPLSVFKIVPEGGSEQDTLPAQDETPESTPLPSTAPGIAPLPPIDPSP
jgi:hypothetical protein